MQDIILCHYEQEMQDIILCHYEQEMQDIILCVIMSKKCRILFYVSL